MVRSNNPYTASLGQWQAAIEQGRFDGEFGRLYGRAQVAAWRANYLEALRHFAARYGSGGPRGRGALPWADERHGDAH